MNRNEMKIEFGSDPRNESFARVVVASFMTRTNPTLEEVADVKTAVSEAVTNSIIHGYGQKEGTIEIRAYIEERKLYIEITDYGCVYGSCTGIGSVCGRSECSCRRYIE